MSQENIKRGFVTFYRIIGTSVVVACVEELIAGIQARTHSTMTTIDGQWCGSLGSRVLPAEVDALPVGPQRSTACKAYKQAQADLAYRLIRDKARAIMTEERIANATEDRLSTHLEWFDQDLANKLEELGGSLTLPVTYVDTVASTRFA